MNGANRTSGIRGAYGNQRPEGVKAQRVNTENPNINPAGEEVKNDLANTLNGMNENSGE